MENTFILGLVLGLFASISITADTPDTAELVKVCDGCHGADGVSQWPDMPTIAGISAFVHSEALFVYRDRARPCATSKFRLGDTNRPATDMCVLAENLNDTQIETIAAHYAGSPFVPAKQSFDAELATLGEKVHDRYCGLCHTDDGANPDDDAGILKGQWMQYMRQTFEEYAAETREQPEQMKRMLDLLSEKDIEALLHFYASP